VPRLPIEIEREIEKKKASRQKNRFPPTEEEEEEEGEEEKRRRRRRRRRRGAIFFKIQLNRKGRHILLRLIGVAEKKCCYSSVFKRV
jgi:hypothetical protein